MQSPLLNKKMCLTPVIKPIKHMNLKNDWEHDLLTFEAIELNDELIQSTEMSSSQIVPRSSTPPRWGVLNKRHNR